MRLSEAIRLGALLHPQGFYAMAWRRGPDGTLSKYDDVGEVVLTCALGAAEAAGYPDVFESRLTDTRARCPVCTVRTYIANVIVHLNDDHRWTREQIADWVATVEPADERSGVPEAIDAVRGSTDQPLVTIRA